VADSKFSWGAPTVPLGRGGAEYEKSEKKRKKKQKEKREKKGGEETNRSLALGVVAPPRKRPLLLQ